MLIDVVLPCLDEAAALPWVLGQMPPGFRPIVADNGSGDGSAQIARRHGARVVDAPQRGFGAACHAGLLAATSQVVCIMDADSSLDPADLPLVAGPGAGRAWPIWCWAAGDPPGAGRGRCTHDSATSAIAAAIRRRADVQVRDLGPMRAARRDGLLALALADRRFGYPLEMVIRAAEAGWQIEERDVPYHPRAAGKSKVTGTVRGTLQTVRDMRRVLAA